MNIDNNHRLIQDLPDYIQYKTQKLLDKNSRTESLFRFATQHLYAPLIEKSINLKEKKIVICGQVHTDGVGDYYHMIHTAEQIKKFYPALNISIIPKFNGLKIPDNLKVLDPTLFNTVLRLEEDIPEEVLDKIKSADLMLDVSSSSHFKKPENYFYIQEYYDKDSVMGVADTGLGIAIKEKPMSTSLINLTHADLKSLFFNSTHPTSTDLEDYRKNHDLYTAYLKKGSYHQMTLLYTLAALSRNSPKPTLDILIPEVDMNILDLEGLKKQGVGKILLIKWINHQLIEKEITLSPEGKVMRLMTPFPLIQEDFYTLLFNSQQPMGCTGDNSISEVLSFELTPFYEIIGVKQPFWDSMIRLAGEVGGPSHYLQQYFRELYTIISSMTRGQVNNLKDYYNRLPRKIPQYLQTLQTKWDDIKKDFESQPPYYSLTKAKNILQQAETLASKFAQDPVKVYLEGNHSNRPIINQVKNLKKNFDSIFSIFEIQDDELDSLFPSFEKSKKFSTYLWDSQDSLSPFLQKSKEFFNYLMNIVEEPEDNHVDRFKKDQPALLEAGERMATLLQKPELQKELSKFTHLLKTQYNYNPVLKDIVGRLLALPDYPELETYEKELFEKFQKDEIDAFTANKLLKEKIASFAQ